LRAGLDVEADRALVPESLHCMQVCVLVTDEWVNTAIRVVV
jgi:hypothetical protein